MKLIKLLQEASSLQISDLKKAMLKDPRCAQVFKKDLKLEDIEDKEGFLSTLKFYIFNNENARTFVQSRHNIKNMNKHEFDKLRKIRASELEQSDIDFVSSFATEMFKEHGEVSKGKLSKDLKDQLKDWFNGNGRYHNIQGWAQEELKSVPGVRPDKRVLLYRGILFPEHALQTHEKYDGTLEIGEGLKFIKTIKKGGKEVDLEWDRPSSWTTSKEVAEKFAKYGPASSQTGAMFQWLGRMSAKKEIDGALGYVISTFANPEDILIDVNRMNANFHMQHGDEGEFILAPGTFKARIVKKFTVEGEVDPAVEDVSSKDSPPAKAIESINTFLASFEIPSEVQGIIKEMGETRTIWSSDSIQLVNYPSLFKKLMLNSTTTIALHTFDKLLDFYNKNLHTLENEELRGDKYATDEELVKKITKLKQFIEKFRQNVIHSKFKSEKNTKGQGKKHDMTAEEYRATIKTSDLADFERAMLVGSRMTDSYAGRNVEMLAKNLGVDLPSSARFTAFGETKQKPILQAIASSFLKSLGLSEGDYQENAKTMINLIRKAYRNYAMLMEIDSMNDVMKEMK
jgi:hypothetical protein